MEKAVRAVLAVMPPVPDPVPGGGPRRAWTLVSEETALRLVPRARRLGAARSGAQAAQVHRGLRRPDRCWRSAATARARCTPSRARAGAGGLLDAFEERMPFALTEGQRAVEAEIVDDLARPQPMQRLLQGEVGSGKTVVALRAMLRVVDSGAQAALLAPTEVLAQQHHRSITADAR